MICENFISRNSRCTPIAHSSLLIIAIEAIRQPFTSTSRQIHHKRRRHESRNRSAKMFFQMQNGRQGSSQIFDAANHVGLIDIVRLNVQIGEFANQRGHGGEVVIDAFEEDGLVPYCHSALKEISGCSFGGPGDFLRIVEMCVHCDLLSNRATEVAESNEGVCPAIVAIEDSHGTGCEAFGCKADPLDMWNLQ